MTSPETSPETAGGETTPEPVIPEGVLAEGIVRKPLVIQLAESTPLLMFAAFLLALAIYAAMRFSGIDDDGPIGELVLGLGFALARGKLVDDRRPPL